MGDSFNLKSKHKSKKGGLTEAGRKSYNRETGSNLKRPQPEGGPRKKSFCARNKGQIEMHNIDCRKTPEKRACLARKRWRCSKSEEMSKSERLRQFMTKVENKRQRLEHYSQKTGLKNIDPKHIGTGLGSRQERNAGHQYSFYYKPGAIKEDLVTGSAKSKYIVEIPEEASLYDLSADPMGFKAKVREENQGAFNPDMLHDKIKEAGFHGFHTPNHQREEMRGVVALYHSQPVSEEHEVWGK
jgi:hypothetical protein